MLVFSVLDWNYLAIEAHAGGYLKHRIISFASEKTPRISLTCKLVPVQYREYQYGLLFGITTFAFFFRLAPGSS